MNAELTIALCQCNPTVGDFSGNAEKIKRAMREAVDRKADLAVFPELISVGYPPRDLVEQSSFIDKNLALTQVIAQFRSRETPDLGVILGYIRRRSDTPGKGLANSALWLLPEVSSKISDDELSGSTDKSLLPTYDVFDESRYFEPGKSPNHFSYRGLKIGLTICEDLWNVAGVEGAMHYEGNPAALLQAQRCDLIINIAASPYAYGKPKFRAELFSEQARRCKIPILMVNQVGANDDLIFDGHSMVIDHGGEVVAVAPRFTEAMTLVHLHKQSHLKISVPDQLDTGAGTVVNLKSDESELLEALILGIRDYFSKLALKRAVIGISGGIDSALVATLAVSALGSENVVGMMMPSRYTSRQSLDDAEALAKNLAIKLEVISIEPIFKNYLETLQPLFASKSPDITEENLQARIRGMLLMAYSNKFGHIVLSTGNKSELATGYCTLYGDLTGGLAVISDVFKTDVYRLCDTLNRQSERASGKAVIPNTIIERAPSAELRDNQTDQDSLPPYEVLDRILQLYIEEQLDRDEIEREIGKSDLIAQVLGMVDRNEFKRRQMPLGLKVSKRAFGQGRRHPIVQKYYET